MNLVTPFSQTTFKQAEGDARLKRNEQKRGLCFRLSYKWCACKVRQQPFKFYGASVGKTYAKQMNYLREPDCVRLEDQASYAGWVLAAHRNDEYFIDTWRKSHGGLTCRSHWVLSVEDFLPRAAPTVSSSASTERLRRALSGGTRWRSPPRPQGHGSSTPTTASILSAWGRTSAGPSTTIATLTLPAATTLKTSTPTSSAKATGLPPGNVVSRRGSADEAWHQASEQAAAVGPPAPGPRADR
jgi:hypothetical protein